MGKPVRMADIAERLEISVVSVSKALAGKPGVSEETRGKVLALARELGYASGRSGGETTGNLGVLVSDRFFYENAFYSNLYRSVVLASGGEGLGCMIEIVSREAERTCARPALAAGRKVDGLIFMGNLAPAYLRAAAGEGLPCLALDFHAPGAGLDCVTGNNLEGGFVLAEHLLAQGVREIGFLGSILATSSIMERYLGYQYALRTAGLVPREDWRLEDRDGSGAFVPPALPETLPRAFLCSCDEAAYHLVEALRRRGLRVPEDVAVCGYDDFRFATLCQPGLTSYHVDVDRMASAAVALLTRRIRQEDAPSIVCTVPGRLVVRDSTRVR